MNLRVTLALPGPRFRRYLRVFPLGEVLRVGAAPPGPLVYCVPKDYSRFERLLVPVTARCQFRSYQGYYLVVCREDIEENCEKLGG